MKALITGATGFAGQHLARHLRDVGDQVWGTYTTASPSEAASVEIPYHAWDISRPAPDSLVETLRQYQPDVIYHLAAMSHPGSCGNDLPTESCQAVNILGTRHVADLALALPAPPKVLFVSSSKVYGPGSAEHLFVKEADPPQPIGGYAHSKWAAENVLHDRAAQGLPVIVARAFNHTGPGQSPIYLVPEWCQRIAAGEDPCRVRSLTTSLDLSDVRDVVRIYRLLVEKGQPGQTYNVGRGEPVTTGEIWNLLCEIIGRRPEVVAEKPEPVQQPIADLAKLEAAIGAVDWIPLRRTLEEVFAAAGRE